MVVNVNGSWDTCAYVYNRPDYGIGLIDLTSRSAWVGIATSKYREIRGYLQAQPNTKEQFSLGALDQVREVPLSRGSTIIGQLLLEVKTRLSVLARDMGVRPTRAH